MSSDGREVRNYNDFSMGADPVDERRYIVCDRSGGPKITKVGLFRFVNEMSEEQLEARIRQSGFIHHSRDLNVGRRGDYLYLLWAYE